MTEKRTAANLADWQGYLTQAEVKGLQTLVSELPPSSTVVKIGSGAGTDTLAMLEARQDLVIFSIDIECCKKPEIVNEHLRILETDWHDTGHLVRVWGDSAVVGKRWPIPVDMVFVDGDHQEPGKRADTLTWLPNVVHDGIIAFHDYGSINWPAVKLVVDELMQDYEEILHVDSLIAFRVVDPIAGLFADCESIPEDEFEYMVAAG